MKMMKRIGVMVGVGCLAVSFGGCSKSDLPQEYNPTEQAVAVETETEKKEEVNSSTAGAPVVEEKKEGPVLVMGAVSDTTKLEGSDGLGFYGVYAEFEDEASITEAIDKGHFFVTTAEAGPIIKATVQEAMIGDTVSFKENMRLKVDVKGIKSGSMVKVTNGTEIVFEEKIMGDKVTERVAIPAKGEYKVEVYTADGQLLALSNTITFGD